MFKLFNNGVIRFVKQIGGGYKNGNPAEAKSVEGEPYPCHIVINTDDKKGMNEGGAFRRATYLIFMDKITTEDEIVRITLNGKELGEFVIQSVKSGKLLNRMEIAV